MVTIGARYIPFAFCLLPFLGVGICLPATIQDWSRGRIMRNDAITLGVGAVILVAWYMAILHSIRSKQRRGEATLLGRELNSWIWSPPVAFGVGVVCGLAMVFF